MGTSAIAAILEGLNEPQRIAVQLPPGPAAIVAGPGAGKTRVLTRRIAYLIEAYQVRPQQIVAVTFTNKAAREMRERLDALIGHTRASRLVVSTFHSLCLRFLRREFVHVDRSTSFTIYAGEDQNRLLRQVQQEVGVDPALYTTGAIRARISLAKRELCLPETLARIAYQDPFDRAVADCYAAYQAALRAHDALDFDDLLFETMQLLHACPDVLRRYQELFVAWHGDEWQDSSPIDEALLDVFVGAGRNLFVVGDDQQSIYRFRGASPAAILRFTDRYPGARLVMLEQNYRSTPNILQVAQAVIDAANGPGHRKQLWTDQAPGGDVQLFVAADQEHEAALVADEIVRLRATGRIRDLRECAILYRTNAMSRALEDALRRNRLRYQIIGTTSFYDRAEIKDLLAYLRVVYNPLDELALQRVLNVPRRALGDASEAALLGAARARRRPLIDVLRQQRDGLLNGAPLLKGAALAGAIALADTIDALMGSRSHKSVLDLLDELLVRIRFQEHLSQVHGATEAAERWANVEELRLIAEMFGDMPCERQLEALLQDIALLDEETASADPAADLVTCMTFHKSKGLEFPVVFLTGVEEKLLPHVRSMEDDEGIEEERRLFYVGITRAQRLLYLSYAEQRDLFGTRSVREPSRFLADIPPELITIPEPATPSLFFPEQG